MSVPSAPGAALVLEGVTVAFGARPVLHGIDLRVEAGEVVAVVGPSGAGKTTLLRLCNATVRATSGRVSVAGSDLSELRGASLRAARADVGFVHQDHALVPNLRVSQNVAAGRLGRSGFLRGLRSMLWPSRDELVRLHALLERVGLEDELFSRADRLSGGQQQRVAIARALWQGPRLLLADEPVASVDPARAQDVVRLLVDLATERGATLVVSLHDLDLARALFPRLVGVRDGRIVLDAAPDAVEPADFSELYALEGAARA